MTAYQRARATALGTTLVASAVTLFSDFLVFSPIVALATYPLIMWITMRTTDVPEQDRRTEKTSLKWHIVISSAAFFALVLLLMAMNPDARGSATSAELRSLMLFGAGLGAVLGIPAMYIWRAFVRTFVTPPEK